MRRSSRVVDIIEGAFIIIAALFSLVISLLDLFGLLSSVPLLANRVPMLTLLLLSIILGLFYRLKLRVDSVEEVKELMGNMGKNLDLVLSGNLLAVMTRSIQRMNPDLRRVFGSEIDVLVNSWVLATTEGAIKISNLESYRYYYIRTLESFPRTTFLATSLPSSTYFWKNTAVEEAIAKFIQNGGAFKRVFYLDDLADLSKEEVRQILKRQLEIGVETYVVPQNAVPPALATLLVIEENARLGWEIATDNARRISNVTAWTNQEQTRRLRNIFAQLLQVDEIRKLTAAEFAEVAPST